jgi:hypothetical protein
VTRAHSIEKVDQRVDVVRLEHCYGVSVCAADRLVQLVE